jgi:PAS domain S-box-containing protein
LDKLRALKRSIADCFAAAADFALSGLGAHADRRQAPVSGENSSMPSDEFIDDAVPAPDWAVGTGRRTSPAFRTAALIIGYVILYVALDRISFVAPLYGVAITPWSPSAGLEVALLVIKGPRYAPLAFAAELLSNATLPVAVAPPLAVLLGTLLDTIVYTGLSVIFRRAGLRRGIRGSSDAGALLTAAVVGPGIVASGFVAIYAAAGIVPWSGFAEAVYHYWIGDAIGITVFLPSILLIHRGITRRKGPDRRESPRQLVELSAQAAAIAVSLAVVFSVANDGSHSLRHFYLVFLPLIWVAVRRGHAGASWAVLAIQIGLIAGLETHGFSEVELRGFQLLMFALAATGLMLGATVSERQRLSQELANSESRRTAVLSTARDGIMTVDGRGRIESVNPAIERLFSRPSHRLIGLDVAELVSGVPDLLQRLKPTDRPPVDEPGFWELDARRADGTAFPVELSAGRFDLHSAEHYTIVLRDITSRRQTEARYREHQAELAHVSRVSLAGEMAAGLAHELSQPLTAITAYARGCLRLLARTAPERELLQEGIGEVVKQAERAGDVLDRLREFVRGGEFRRVLTEVKVLIDAAISLIRMEAMRQGVEIRARVDQGLPPVLADRIQIEQVLLNLLRNAMDAMEEANTRRRSILVAVREVTHAVEISVADSGPGIPDEVKDSIFRPFVTTKPLGMGMGLSISRSIVESHGGKLRVRRRAPTGVVFFFDLPTAEAAATIDAG